MPAITSGKVLVTGANGYIASWVVGSLLQQGYSVRGTVRAEEKGQYLKEIYKSYGNKLELVVVDDLTKEGIFDDAVKGVDAIAHLASPVRVTRTDPDEIVVPAVQGTANIFTSALTYGSSLKRFILTSSCAAVFTISDKPRTFSEEDWNDAAIEQLHEQGKNAEEVVAYMASKVFAERATWALYEANKDTLPWDLVVLTPPFVVGPTLQPVSSLEELGYSSVALFNAICVPSQDRIPLTRIGQCWIDVRDYANANVTVLETPEAGGERFIVSAGTFTWEEWAIEARKFSKDLPAVDEAYNPAEVRHLIKYNTTKADRILGIKYRSMGESARDLLLDFKKKGLWDGTLVDVRKSQASTNPK
ncbi:NAD-P-binding protein [Amylocystis lapponica]|nr:NAD-P-binding protein [Amylocystis lapponica]